MSARTENDGCQFCGWTDDELGLDASHTDRGIYVEWHPCCEAKREYVGMHGWSEAHGETLERSLELRIGLSVRQVYLSDSLCRFKLTLREPGNGVRGWQTEVFEDVDEHHSHHDSPAGWKYGIAVYNGPVKVGVAVVGRPVARMIATREPGTLEVTRVCCFGDPRLRRNAASKLYGACAREAARRGYDKLITYTLESEDGASTKAANFVPVHQSEGGSWSRADRKRDDKAPTCPKVRWALGLDRATRKAVAAERIDLEADARLAS